jgi:hypothetical protein
LGGGVGRGLRGADWGEEENVWKGMIVCWVAVEEWYAVNKEMEPRLGLYNIDVG